LIVQGEAKVFNQYDPCFCKLKQGDYFGAGKYFDDQRFTYYGDVCAWSFNPATTSKTEK
jgi:hypothetical protein